MKKAKLSYLALLLAPAATFAATVSIDWTGKIDPYAATAGSGYPQSLSDISVSGVFSFNTDLLPTPDAGNPPGVVSFGGSGYLQSNVHWAGGLFQSEPTGSSGSNSLYIDTVQNRCTITDSGTYVDALGSPHLPLVSLNLTGLDQLATSFGAGSPGSTAGSVSGSGIFGDSTLDTMEGFVAAFTEDSIAVTVSPGSNPVAAPEIEPACGISALTLLAGVLAVIRGRRRSA
jgi:hypothetical protein